VGFGGLNSLPVPLPKEDKTKILQSFRNHKGQITS